MIKYGRFKNNTARSGGNSVNVDFTSDNEGFSKRILRVLPERAKRTYFGGREIDRFTGTSYGDGEYPEMWIASTVQAFGSDSDEGLSKAVINNEIFILKDLIEKDPMGMLGEEHFLAGYKDSPGVLVKMIDSLNRLIIQVHPNLSFAKKVFNSDYGKAEGWYILRTRTDINEKPYVLLGFKEGITREKWKDAILRQDIDEMIDCLHKFHVNAGDIFFVEGGVPHAIGPGCCLIEAQEATDYTLRAEMKTPDGKPLPEESIHLGAGFEALFDCFSYEGLSREETIRRWKLKARVSEEPKLKRTCIFSEELTKTFGMEELTITGSYRLNRYGRFAICFVLDGTGSVETSAQTEVLKKGDILFIPAEVNESIWKPTGHPLKIILCYPSLTKRQADVC
jgi:mannose-6-phosphate isomerase